MNYRNVFLATMVAAALCGCSTGKMENESLESETVTTVGEVTQNNDMDKGENTSLENVEIPHLSFEVLNRTASEKMGDNGTLYKELSYGHIYLMPGEGDKFPKLNEALTTLNSETDAGVDEAIAKLEQLSYDVVSTQGNELGEYGYILSDTVDYVLRSDYKVVSVLRNNYSSVNGNKRDVHYKSFNIDTATGELLNVGDVVSDIDLFFENLESLLGNNYGEEYRAYANEYEEGLKDPVDLAWTITQEGLTVYFDSKTPEVEGEITATLYFDQNPNLFKPDYTKALEDYVIPITGVNTLRMDVDGDGKRDDVSITQAENTATVKAGDKEITDIYSYNTQAYMVKKEGNYYLYMFTSRDNDYVVLDIIDLKNMAYNASDSQNIRPAVTMNSWGDGDINYSSTAESKFVDTELFTGDSSLNVLSTYFGRRNYKVGSDGKPEALDQYYTVVGSRIIQANTDIECESVNIAGESGERAIIPAGSYLMILRTDGGGQADVKILDPSQVNRENLENTVRISSDAVNEINEGETIYRLNVDMTEWPGKINGINVEELFTGIHFAG